MLIAIIRRRKGQFGVEFPDFPNCTASGRTFAEARTNATIALARQFEQLMAANARPEPEHHRASHAGTRLSRRKSEFSSPRADDRDRLRCLRLLDAEVRS